MMNEKGKTQAVSAFVACLMLFLFSAQALSATITSWGRDIYNQVTNTPSDTNFTAIAGAVTTVWLCPSPPSRFPPQRGWVWRCWAAWAWSG